MSNQDCIFCKIARKKIPVEFVEETENFVAFPDAKPRTKGHTLIIPKKHFVNFLDMPSDLGSELSDIIKKVAEKRLKQGAKGFNIVMNNFPDAGQVVMHAHMHIIPRISGDGFHCSL